MLNSKNAEMLNGIISQLATGYYEGEASYDTLYSLNIFLIPENIKEEDISMFWNDKILEYELDAPYILMNLEHNKKGIIFFIPDDIRSKIGESVTLFYFKEKDEDRVLQ